LTDSSLKNTILKKKAYMEKPNIENPFVKMVLPNFKDIPPLRYINALPIPSPKLPELPNFKTMSQSSIEPEEE
jgi:hypothetical protein